MSTIVAETDFLIDSVHPMDILENDYSVMNKYYNNITRYPYVANSLLSKAVYKIEAIGAKSMVEVTYKYVRGRI